MMVAVATTVQMVLIGPALHACPPLGYQSRNVVIQGFHPRWSFKAMMQPGQTTWPGDVLTGCAQTGARAQALTKASNSLSSSPASGCHCTASRNRDCGRSIASSVPSGAQAAGT